MPTESEVPLPPLPIPGEELSEFVSRHRPEDLARLAIAIHDGPRDNSVDELTGELTQAIIDKFARTSPETLLAYAEHLLASQVVSLQPEVSMMADSMLGRGIARFEEMVWDVLLESSDAEGLGYLIEQLEAIMRGEYPLFDNRTSRFEQEYQFAYDAPTRMSHYVRLNRARYCAKAILN